MGLSDQQLLEQARDVSQGFVEEYYPEELIYFPVVCEQTLTPDFVGLRGQGKMALPLIRDRLKGLRFAEKAGIRLVSPFVLLTATAILAELNVVPTVPPEHQVGDGIQKCAIEFGAPRRLAKELASALAPKLHSLFSEAAAPPVAPASAEEAVPPQVIYINPSGKSMVGNNKFPVGSTQPHLLLQELLRKDKVHWTEGFLIFPTWRSEAPDKPRRQFETVVGLLNTDLHKLGAHLCVIPEKSGRRNTGFWALDRTQNVELRGPLVEAQDLSVKARNSLVNRKYLDAVTMASQALRLDNKSLSAAKVLAESLPQAQRGSVDASLVVIAAQLLRDTATDLQTAIEKLQQHGKAAEWRAFSTIVFKKAIPNFTRESGEISRLSDLISDFCEQAGISLVTNAELDRVNALMESLRRKEIEDEDKLYELLSEDPVLKSVTRAVLTRIKRMFPRMKEEDSLREVLAHLHRVVMKAKDPKDYGSLDKFRNSLARRLAIETAEGLVDQQFGLSKKIQADMRKYRTDCGRLKTEMNREEPSDDDVLRILGPSWNELRLDAAKKAESALLRSREEFRLDEYWRIFRPKRAPRQLLG